MTRPEGLFFFGVALVTAGPWNRGGRVALGELLRPILPFAAVVGTCVIAAYSYYGTPWPNSLDAKVGFSSEQLLRGSRYAARFIVTHPVITLLLLAGALRLPTAPAFERCCTMLGWFSLVFYGVAGGDWMPGYRLFHPTVVLACCLGPTGREAARRFVADTMRGPRKAVPALMVFLAATVTLSASVLDPRIHEAARRTYVHDGIRVGNWMKSHLPAGSLLATNTAGTVAYYSGLPVLDMMGLNDLTIANRRDVPRSWKGIEKGDGRYVLGREPEYIQFGSSTGSARPIYLTDIELFTNRLFWKRYDLVEHGVDDDLRLLLYERRNVPRPQELGEEQWAEILRVARERMERSAFRY